MYQHKRKGKTKISCRFKILPKILLSDMPLENKHDANQNEALEKNNFLIKQLIIVVR